MCDEFSLTLGKIKRIRSPCRFPKDISITGKMVNYDWLFPGATINTLNLRMNKTDMYKIYILKNNCTYIKLSEHVDEVKNHINIIQYTVKGKQEFLN